MATLGQITSNGQDGSEYLHVECVGSSRASALTLADSQARQYFGPGRPLVREIGRAQAASTRADGTVSVWSVSVDYREQP